MSFVDAGRRLCRHGAGDHRHVRGVFRRACRRSEEIRHAAMAAHPLRRGDPQVRHRQAGPAQPDRDAGRDRAFPRLGLQDLRRHDREGPEGARVGDPGAGRRLARLLRPHELLGAGRGPAGARLHLLAQCYTGRQAESRDVTKPARRRQSTSPHSKFSRRRAHRQEHRPRTLRSCASSLVLAMATRCSSPPATRTKFYKFAGEARIAHRHGAEADRREQVRARLDRRLPVLRVERGGEEDRLLAQPVLDAAGRPRRRWRPPRATRTASRSRRYQYDIVCNGFEIASGVDPQPPPRYDGEGLRDRRARRRPSVEARFGGMLPRVPVRRAAARRHGGRHRPHRHAAGRRQEPARGHAVPDEPAGQRPADGRAVARCCPSSCASLHIRVVAPEKKE